MPVLKNTRHENFAQAMAKGKTADDAYVEAGFTHNRGNAARLKANESIRKRVTEITSRVSEKAEWSAAERLLALKRITDAAEKADPRVAVSAIAEANKMQGSHAPAKHQHGGTIATVDVTKLKGMSDEELDLLERALVQIGIVDGDPGREGEPEE